MSEEHCLFSGSAAVTSGTTQTNLHRASYILLHPPTPPQHTAALQEMCFNKKATTQNCISVQLWVVVSLLYRKQLPLVDKTSP